MGIACERCLGVTMITNITQATVHRSGHIGVETTSGTRVDANLILEGVSIAAPAPQYTSTEVAVEGYKFNPLTIVGARHTTGSIEGNLDYNTTTYLLASAMNYSAPTLIAGSSAAYRWAFSPNPAGKDTFKTFTAQWGDDYYSDYCSGIGITEFKIEAAASDSAVAVSGSWIGKQLIRDKLFYVNVSGASGGTFKIGIEVTATTAPIAFDALAATVEAELNSLINIGTDGILVSGSAGGPYTVTFDGTGLAKTNVASLVASHVNLTGGSSPSITITTTTPGTGIADEVQLVTINGTPTGGTFRLQFTHSYQTAGIAYNASAATIQTALLTTIPLDTGDVVCDGGAANTLPVSLLFGGRYSDLYSGREEYSHAPTVTVDGASLTGAGAAIAVSRIYPTITTRGMKPVTVEQVNVYFADRQSELDNSDLFGSLYNFAAGVSDVRGPEWTISRDRGSYNQLIDLKPGAEVTLQVGVGAAADLLPYLEQGKRVFVLIDALSNENIEAGFPYSLKMYLCISLGSQSAVEDSDGLATITLTGVIARDATWGKGIEVIIDNALSAL